VIYIPSISSPTNWITNQWNLWLQNPEVEHWSAALETYTEPVESSQHFARLSCRVIHPLARPLCLHHDREGLLNLIPKDDISRCTRNYSTLLKFFPSSCNKWTQRCVLVTRTLLREALFVSVQAIMYNSSKICIESNGFIITICILVSVDIFRFTM